MPAANPNKRAVPWFRSASTTMFPVMPPTMKGRTSTGSPARNSVTPRRAWITPLPRITSKNVKGVRKSRPSVPSRFSRLMQSAVIKGTTTQNVRVKVRSKAPNRSWPNDGPRAAVSITLAKTTIIAPAASTRSQ